MTERGVTSVCRQDMALVAVPSERGAAFVPRPRKRQEGVDTPHRPLGPVGTTDRWWGEGEHTDVEAGQGHALQGMHAGANKVAL